MSQGYAIYTVVGVMARWLPSEAAAKARYLEAVAESRHADDPEPAPSVTFEPSTTGEYGEPLAPYVQVLEDGRWQASIQAERPHWPESNVHGISPPLTMLAQARPGGDPCGHPELTCGNTAPHFAPMITCARCGAVWRPE